MVGRQGPWSPAPFQHAYLTLICKSHKTIQSIWAKIKIITSQCTVRDYLGFLGGAVVKKKKKKTNTSPDNARNSMDMGLIPGWGRSLLGGKGNPL